MALYDPDAAGTAAQYLRLPSEELLQVRNVPFTAKTAVWIPHSETAYTKGEIMGRKKSKEAGKGDKIEVKRLCDGKIKKYSPDDVEPQNPPKYELLEDIANLTYLSEASVVHDLGERYRKFLIYTYSGLFCVYRNNTSTNCTLCRSTSLFHLSFLILIRNSFPSDKKCFCSKMLY